MVFQYFLTPESCLGRAVKTAQALNLDKDRQHSTCLQDEMRHRLWWDLANADMYVHLQLLSSTLMRPTKPIQIPVHMFESTAVDSITNPWGPSALELYRY